MEINNKMSKKSKLTYFLLMSTLFIWVNFYCSDLITYNLDKGWRFSNSFLTLVYVENTGAAFSLLQNATHFLIILSIIALLVIFYLTWRNFEILSAKGLLFLSMLIAGITGNLVERLILGHVRDFFDLTFLNFPIFNISDIFINIGVFGIIILILLSKKPIRFL